MTGEKLRVGIIGAGGISRGAHIPGWKDNPNVELVAIADINYDLAKKVAEEHKIAKAFGDYRDLLAAEQVDAVDICTPNKLHMPMVLASLEAGKHTICEKPLATTPQEIERMIEARDQSGKLLMTAQHNRFKGMSLAIRKWIEGGAVGDIYYARAWALRRNLLPPGLGFISKQLAGGGPCMDIGVHILDLTMWFMDHPEPLSVTGSATANLAKSDIIPGAWGEWDRSRFDVEDFACGMVRFANGAMLTLEASWLGHTPQPEDMSCMLLGTKAGVSWPSGAVCTAMNGTLVDASLKPIEMKQTAYAVELKAFYEAIINGRPSPVPPEDSLKGIRILDGIYRSQQSGKEIDLREAAAPAPELASV